MRVIKSRGALNTLRSVYKRGVALGALSLGCYWIAVWAFTQASIALAAVLRETGMPFCHADCGNYDGQAHGQVALDFGISHRWGCGAGAILSLSLPLGVPCERPCR